MSNLKDIKKIFEGQFYKMDGAITLDRNHVEWLIEQAEMLQRIADHWVELETSEEDVSEEVNDFYSYVQDVLTPEQD
jgi:hypothetical protein